ncbi:MAG: sulfotransferase family 2 domain-containing protein [Paracoccaceae bacterium]
MLILWNEKLAILAVPKTGTTAIEAALAPFAAMTYMRPPGVKHMTLRRFDRFIRPYLEKSGMSDVETFALMREPMDWLGSWYRYRRRDQIKGSEKSTSNVSFEEFVRAYLQPGNRPAFADLGSQARQLCGKGGNIGVDHLFRYEEMDKAVRFLSARLGRNIALEKSNVSQPMDLSLSPDLAARLRQHFASDLEIYASIL